MIVVYNFKLIPFLNATFFQRQFNPVLTGAIKEMRSFVNDYLGGEQPFQRQ